MTTSREAATSPVAVLDATARILVVEGDAPTARMIAAVLRNDGHAARALTTLPDALDALATEPYDVVLLDAHIPSGQSGDPFQRVRRAAPFVTVIILARYDALDASLRALRAGAYAHLPKPLDMDELRVTVHRAAEHRRLQGELAARVAELEAAHDELQTFNARLRQQVDESTAELRAKVRELDETNQELHDAQDQHDRFVAMVAHEMRGPLNPIINYAQLAKRPTATHEAVERYTDLIIEHAYKLNRLVDDLQTATHLSTGQFSLRRTQCDVAAAVAATVEQFDAASVERIITLERPDAPIPAEVDPDRLGQAIRNLIDNAVKYSVEGGAIEVAVRAEGDVVCISVGDFGAGIPESEMKRIFDAFTRLADRSERVGGSGLGLFITRGIVAAHGGTLAVRNRGSGERAEGAIFTIVLPLRAASPSA